MQHLGHAEVAQRARHVVEAAHRDAARQHQHVVRGEVHGESLAQHRRVVGQVVLGDLPAAAQRERAAQRVGIRASHLPGLDRLAGLDQFVAGGDHQDARLGANVGARQAGRGEHREFRRPEARAAGQQQVALAAVEAAGVDVAERLDGVVGLDLRPAVGDREAFDGDHAVAARRQHRAGHHLEARLGRQGLRAGAGGLRAGDAEASLAGAPRLAGDGDAVHGDAVERRLVALGPHRLRQHGARERRQRARLDRQRRDALPDQCLGFGRGGQGLHGGPVPRAYFFCAALYALRSSFQRSASACQLVERGVVLLGVHGLDGRLLRRVLGIHVVERGDGRGLFLLEAGQVHLLHVLRVFLHLRLRGEHLFLGGLGAVRQ